MCDEFRRKQSVNPFTGRKIKIGGPTHKKLVAKCGNCKSWKSEPLVIEGEVIDFAGDEYVDMVNQCGEPAIGWFIDDCDEWDAEPDRNPQTGKIIKVDGPTYRAIEKKCKSAVVSRSDCNKWKKRPDRNPINGDYMVIGGGAYNSFGYMCGPAPPPPRY